MILVTGATGLLGSHLIHELLQSHTQIKALVRNKAGIEVVRKTLSYYIANTDEILARIEWTEGDICDLFSLHKAFEGVTKVYHTAAVVSFSPKDNAKLFEINVGGTTNVVNMCLEKDIEKLCHVSSIAALGREKNTGIVDENAPWETHAKRSAYAKSKHMAEMEVWRGMAEGLNAVIVNPSVIIGPGNWHKGSSKIIQSVWEGMKYYTEGITGFVGVKDTASFMHKLMESQISAERFVVSSENMSYKSLLYLIADHLSVSKPSTKASPFMSELAWRLEKAKSFLTKKQALITKETARTAQKKYYFSNKKSCDALDFTYTPMHKVIGETARFFLNDLGASNNIS